jgi:hypothetical protein
MSRYIDAEKIEYKTVAYPVFDFSTGMVYTKCLEGEYARQEDIESLPKADVQEVKRGKWDVKDLTPYCSICHRPSEYECDGVHSKPLFCPNCGAKMDGGESK